MSEVTNVKVVRFENGRKEGYGETLYAHDWGQKIRFEGIELPENYEVHFSDLPDGIGTPRLGNADGVEVPRAYLMHPGMLYLWIFLHFGDGDGTTVYRAAMEVAQKADGSVTPSEEEKDIIQQAVEALNGANEVVERAEEVSDHMDRMLAAVEAMPQATYLECSLLGHYGAVYEIRPEGSPISVSTDCLGLIMNKPDGYDPRDNDLLFIKMTKDLVIPERRESVVDIRIVFDMSWTDYSGERPLVYTDYESHEILNIGYEYPAGLVAFEKNRIYTFRHRLVPTGGGNNKSTYEIINYAPGMKEAVTEMQTLVANTRTEMNNLVQNTAVRHDISQGLSVTQKATARTNIGAAALENGKVPESQLPSYVDDVLEYASLSAFPATGEAGKIYVALDTNLTYRWSGSSYVEISQSLALGEVTGTAFPGERGKAVEDLLAAVNKNVYAAVTDVQTASGGFVINCETDEEYTLQAGDILYVKYTDNVQTVNASNQYMIRLSDQNGSVYFTAVIGNIGATEYPAGVTVFENGHTYAYYYNGTNLQVVGLDAVNLGDIVGTAFPGERGKAVEEDAEEALARAKISYGQCTEIVTNPNLTPRPEGSLIQRQIKVDVPEGYEPRDGDYLTVTFQADEVSSPPQAYRIHYNYKGADIALDGTVKGLGDVDRFADGETVFEAGSSYLFRYDGVNGWWWIVGYRYGVSLGETALTAFPGNRGKAVEDVLDAKAPGIEAETDLEYTHVNTERALRLQVTGNEYAFETVKMANKANILTNASGAYNGLGITMNKQGHYAIINGLATSAGTPNFVFSGLALAAGQYKVVVYVSDKDITTNFKYRYRYNGGTNTTLKNIPISNGYGEVTIDFEQPTEAFDLYVVINNGRQYDNTKVWFGLFEADVEIKETNINVEENETKNYYDAELYTWENIDTMLHKSKVLYIIDTKTYVDSHTIDISEELTYVTPEQFGAKGTGIDDDTSAIEQCIRTAIEQDKNVYGANRYRVTKNITIQSNEKRIFIHELRCYSNALGDDEALLTVKGSRNHIEIDLIAGPVAFCSTANINTQDNYFKANYIVSNGNYALKLYGDTSEGAPNVMSYNIFMLHKVYSLTGNAIVCGAYSSENKIYNAHITCPNGWGYYDPRALRVFGGSMESDVLNGIYVTTDAGIFIGCRHGELVDKLADRILGLDKTGGILVKLVGTNPKIAYIGNQRVYYMAIDVTEMCGIDDPQYDSLGPETWRPRQGRIDAITPNTYIQGPVSHGTYSNKYGATLIGMSMTVVGGKKICKPVYNMKHVVQDSDFDMRDSMDNLKNCPYATYFVIDAENCVIHLASSYCCMGYSEIIIDQQDPEKLCTIYKDSDDQTPIFDGQTLGVGVYKLKATYDGTVIDPVFATETPSITCYSGRNDKWTIMKLDDYYTDTEANAVIDRIFGSST